MRRVGTWQRQRERERREQPPASGTTQPTRSLGQAKDDGSARGGAMRIRKRTPARAASPGPPPLPPPPPLPLQRPTVRCRSLLLILPVWPPGFIHRGRWCGGGSRPDLSAHRLPAVFWSRRNHGMRRRRRRRRRSGRSSPPESEKATTGFAPPPPPLALGTGACQDPPLLRCP